MKAARPPKGLLQQVFLFLEIQLTGGRVCQLQAVQSVKYEDRNVHLRDHATEQQMRFPLPHTHLFQCLAELVQALDHFAWRTTVSDTNPAQRVVALIQRLHEIVDGKKESIRSAPQVTYREEKQ